MTQKELLYLEDILSHEEYFIQHLLETKDQLDDEEMIKLMQKLIKKNKEIYKNFYELL